jgi:hypothetical protein
MSLQPLPIPPMRQVWLRPNLRALSISLILPALLLAAGLAMLLLIDGTGTWATLRLVGWGLVALAAVVAGLFIYVMRMPRLAYQNGYLLVYLRSMAPVRVPIDLVECFFLGQDAGFVSSPGGKEMETSTIVVRLAESAAEWRHVEVNPSLGRWCDGYITIRGTWCEPISGPLMKELNARLVEAHRSQRLKREVETA